MALVRFVAAGEAGIGHLWKESTVIHRMGRKMVGYLRGHLTRLWMTRRFRSELGCPPGSMRIKMQCIESFDVMGWVALFLRYHDGNNIEKIGNSGRRSDYGQCQFKKTTHDCDSTIILLPNRISLLL